MGKFMHIISNEVDCMQDCRSREGLEGQWSPLQIFADNLTLSHSGGKFMPTTLLLPLPARFSDLPTALVCSGIHYSHEAAGLSEPVGQILKDQATLSQQGEPDYANHINNRPLPPPSYGPELKRASPITKLCRQQHESCDKCLPVHYSVVPTNFGWSPDIQNPFLGGFTQATTKNSSTHTKPLNNFI